MTLTLLAKTVCWCLMAIFTEISGVSIETQFKLTLLDPPNDSTIYCKSGALHATAKLGLSASVIVEGEVEDGIAATEIGLDDFSSEVTEHLVVEIVVDPHIGDSESVGYVPLHLLSSAGIELDGLFPGHRTVRIRLLDTTENIVLTELTSMFSVQCGDDTFDVFSVLSSYDENSIDRAQYFEHVYKYKMWSLDQSESGTGSTTAEAMNVSLLIRDLVQNEMQSHFSTISLPPPRHIFDIPCGDLHWVRALLPFLRRQGVSYHGMDVSRGVIARNQEQEQRQRGEGGSAVLFSHLDVVTDPLPEMPAPSLLICRHLMLHLSISDNLTILYKLLSSGAHYLLLTTFVDPDDVVSDNERVFPLYHGHRINLLRRPYCLRPPLLLHEDSAPVHMGLWDIRTFNEHNAGDFFDFDNCRL